MITNAGITDADKQYKEAHAEHYVVKDLYKAFELYRGIMVTHPKSRAAELARAQLDNIMNFIIPENVLFDNKINLALVHFENVLKA